MNNNQPISRNTVAGTGDNENLRMLSFLKGSTTTSGVNTYYRNIALELSLRGHHVTTAVTEDKSGKIFKVLGDNTGNIESLSLKGNRYRLMINLFKKVQPTVVLNHYSEFGLQCTAVARHNGYKFHNLYVCHADTEDHYNIISRFKAVIDRVISVNSICSSEVARQFPDKFTDSPVFPAGVDLPAKPVSIPESGPLNIIYSGRMAQRQKRVLDLVPLVAKLDSMDFDYRLHLAGDGPDLDILRDNLNGEKIHIHGWLHPGRVQDLFSGCHVLLMMSDFEGTSVTLLEAMGHGLVPVVTDIRGIHDVIDNKRNGLLFTVGNIDEAAEHLLELDRNRAMASAIGKEARFTIEDKFAAANISEDFIRYLNSMGMPEYGLSSGLERFLEGGFLSQVDKPYMPNSLVHLIRNTTSIPLIQKLFKPLPKQKV